MGGIVLLFFVSALSSRGRNAVRPDCRAGYTSGRGEDGIGVGWTVDARSTILVLERRRAHRREPGDWRT